MPTQRIFAATDQRLLGSGIQKAEHELTADLFVDGYNVEFRDGRVRKSRGWVLPIAKVVLFDDATGNFDSAPGLFDSGGPAGVFSTGISGEIVGVQQQKTSDSIGHIFFGTISQLYHSTGGAASAVGSGAYTGQQDENEFSVATLWSMVAYGDWMIATDGKDVPQIYKGVSFAALGGISGHSDPSTEIGTAEIVQTLGPSVVLLNLDSALSTYAFSSATSSEEWDPVTYATAGRKTIRELGGDPIISAVRLGSDIAYYGTNMMGFISYRGAPFIIGDKPAVDGIGALSKHSIVAVGLQHFGWGPDGIFVTDGASRQYLDDPKVRRFLQDNVNYSQKSKIWGYNNKAQHSVEWYYPSSGTAVDSGISFNYKSGGFSFKNFGRNIGVERRFWAGPLLATNDGNLFAHEQGVDANGSALAAQLVSKGLIGDPDSVPYYDYAKFLLRDLVDTVQVEFATLEDSAGTPSYGTPTTLANGAVQVPIDLAGPFLKIRISSSAVGNDFTLAGFEIFGVHDVEALE